MKNYNIYRFTLILLVLVCIMGCQEEEKPNLGKNSQWVQFDSEEYAVTENSASPLVVHVLLASDKNPDGVTINYNVTTDNADAFSLEPSGSVTIPAGEFSADITISPIDNAETDGNKSLTLSLQGDDIPVGINGEGLLNQSATVTITDDDCALDMKSFEGSYLAKEFGYCDGCYTVNITYDETNNVLVLDNLYETGGTTYIELDNSDPSNPVITYRSKELGGALQVNADYGDVWATTPTNNPSSFRTCDNFLDLYFERCVSAGCFNGGPVHIQLTKI